MDRARSCGVACPACGVVARPRPRPVPVRRPFSFVLLLGLLSVGLYLWYYYWRAFKETEAARGVPHHALLFWMAALCTAVGAVVGGLLLLRGGNEEAVRALAVVAAVVLGLYLFVEVMAFAESGGPPLPPMLLPALGVVAALAAPTPPLFAALALLHLLASYWLVDGLNQWIADQGHLVAQRTLVRPS